MSILMYCVLIVVMAASKAKQAAKNVLKGSGKRKTKIRTNVHFYRWVLTRALVETLKSLLLSGGNCSKYAH